MTFAQIAAVLETAESDVLVQSTRVAQLYGFDVDREVLIAQLKNEAMESEVRVSALDTLAKRNDPALAELANQFIRDADPALWESALEGLLVADVQEGVQKAIATAENSPLTVKQRAIALLGKQSDATSAEFLEKGLRAILDGEGPADTMLDVIEASRDRRDSGIQDLVGAYDQSILTAPPMKKYATPINSR